VVDGEVDAGRCLSLASCSPASSPVTLPAVLSESDARLPSGNHPSPFDDEHTCICILLLPLLPTRHPLQRVAPLPSRRRRPREAQLQLHLDPMQSLEPPLLLLQGNDRRPSTLPLASLEVPRPGEDAPVCADRARRGVVVALAGQGEGPNARGDVTANDREAVWIEAWQAVRDWEASKGSEKRDRLKVCGPEAGRHLDHSIAADGAREMSKSRASPCSCTHQVNAATAVPSDPGRWLCLSRNCSPR
jgi:hypothetical protein